MVSSGSKIFISQADKVGLNLAGRLAVDTVNCLIARICDFFGVSDSLIFGVKFVLSASLTAASLYTPPNAGLSLLVMRLVPTPRGIDLGILRLKTVDQIFVQITGCGNGSIIESGSSQHLVGFFGKIRKVTAVNTDTIVCKFDTFFSHFFEDTDRIRNTGFQDIISIYQQSAGIWIHFGVCFESCVFIWEAHDPAVGMCSQNRYVKHLSGQYVGSSCASTDDSCTSTIDTGIRPLCTTQTEFHEFRPHWAA